MKLELVRSNSPLLKRPAQQVPTDLLGSCYFHDLVDSLMHFSRRDLGIAANQVGKDLRIAIIHRIDPTPWVLITHNL